MDRIKKTLDKRLKNLQAADFIPFDPISVPHRYQQAEDIELSGFLTALLSWGRRDLIIRGADALLKPMGDHPYEFLLNADANALKFASQFVYRTMNGRDALFLLQSLQALYRRHDSLEVFFRDKEILNGLSDLRNALLEFTHEKRSEKHLADVRKKAAAKRLQMFLRWMVRRDEKGIDFGLWKSINPANLILPLDVHTANSAREFGLTARKQNDLTTALEITEILKAFDPVDPVKYDLALFMNDDPA